MDRRRFLKYASATLASTTLTNCHNLPESNVTDCLMNDAKWSQFKSELTGKVICPTDLDYRIASQTNNLRFDSIEPQGIVRCANAKDIIKTLAFARKNKIAVVPRCGGHSYAGYSSTTGLVIDVRPINNIEVNKQGTAKIGAGATLMDVYDQLIKKGVSIPSGNCPTVGISGVTLGGGLGRFDRQYGLTCDNLVALEIVTANRELLQCDLNNNSDLFWALRGGGGGNFGVVVSFTFKTHPIQNVTYFSASFHFEDAAKVISSWQELPESCPDNFGGVLFFNILPNSVPRLTFVGSCLGNLQLLNPIGESFFLLQNQLQ